MNLLRLLPALLICCLSGMGVAGGEPPIITTPERIQIDIVDPLESIVGYVARIELNNPDEVKAALQRAEELFIKGGFEEGLPPVVFILHGPEVEIFFKENYLKYKGIVDVAARLSAFDVVDVKVCETRMSMLEASEKPLHPFVGTVVFGPAELDRLRNKEQYDYF